MMVASTMVPSRINMPFSPKYLLIALKIQTMKAKLEELGVLPSYSRPCVSNDNAFVESPFRVLKYRPQ